MLTTIAKPKTWPDPPISFREKNSPRRDQPDTQPADKSDAELGKAVLCRSCRSVVTSLAQEVSVEGRQLHTFFNPAGIVYEIRCFSKAPGCIIHGKPTDEFTWFQGYTWEYSLCGTCFEHLGWFYNSSASSFFGLIDSKLIIDEPPP